MAISLLFSLLVTVATALEQDYSEMGNFDEVYVDDAGESGSEDIHEGESEYDGSFVGDTEQYSTAYDEEYTDTYYINDEEYNNIESFYYSIAEASDTDIRLQAGTARGEPGETVFVSIEMEQNLRGLGAIVYYIEFDATRLELVGVVAGDVLPIPMAPPLSNNPLRVLSIDLAGVGAAAGVTGTLATVEFRVRDNAPTGVAAVDLRTHEASGPVGNLGERTHSATGGSVTVTYDSAIADVRLEAGTVSGAPGATVFVPIELEQNLRGLGAIVYYIEFDATRLELVGVVAGDVLPIPMAPPLSNNPLRVLSVDLSGAGAATGVTGTLATVEFRIRDDAPLGETVVGLRTHEASGPVGNLGERTHAGLDGSVIIVDTVEHEVTFLLNDGTATVHATVTVSDGSTVTPPVVPTRTGYTFRNWYTTVAGTTAFNFGTPITSDMTLHAGWTEGEPTEPVQQVFFWLNDGSGNLHHVAYVVGGNTATPPSVPTRTGYTFRNWYTTAAGTTAFNFGTAITNTTNVFAGWTEGEPTNPVQQVFFWLNDGSGNLHYVAYVVGGSTVSAPSVPTRTGHTFRNWYTTAATTVSFNFATAINNTTNI
ncbi:MAG: InlB B-repeat-containing protein, partial [Oscillospiraceae bacterium]|nr:InlB B-repeat-containing protein [Oscillospiraceae bacterium]